MLWVLEGSIGLIIFWRARGSVRLPVAIYSDNEAGGRAPHPRGQVVAPLALILSPIFLIFSKNKFRGVSGHSENFCFCT